MAQALNLPTGVGLTLPYLFTSAAANLSLNAAYTFGSAGNVLVVRFTAPAAVTLTDLYAYCFTTIGTIGNVQAKAELRTISGTTIDSTLIATSGAGTVAGTPRWMCMTFSSPPTLTAGQSYALVIYNSAASPTVDAPGIQYQGGPVGDANNFIIYSSVNGGSTLTVRGASPMVVKLGDGSVLGNAFNTASVSYTSNTRERGIYLPAPDVSMVLDAVTIVSNASVNGLKIYKGSTAPGSSPGTGELLVSMTPGAGCFNGLNFTLAAGQDYRIVFTFSGNSNAPTYSIATDLNRFADLALAMPWGYDTIDNGSGGWTNNTDRLPKMNLYFKQLIAAGGQHAFVG